MRQPTRITYVRPIHPGDPEPRIGPSYGFEAVRLNDPHGASPRIAHSCLICGAFLISAHLRRHAAWHDRADV